MAEKTVCLPPCAPVVGALPVAATSNAAAAATPFPVTVANCAADVVINATSTVQALIPAGTVVFTKRCPTDLEFDHSVLCDKVTGEQVIAVTSYSVAGVPTTLFYTLAGTPYGGTANDLEACASGFESDSLDWCAAGVNFTQWIVKKAGQPTGTVYWTDDTGAVVGAPAGATRGICAVPAGKTLIYMERNGGTVTMADIVANTGGRVMSVTVKQIAGRGNVTGDSGSGVPLDEGEVWSWSAVSVGHAEDLNSSALSMDTGGGEQRITAMYTV